MAASQTVVPPTRPQASGPVAVNVSNPQYNVSIGYLRAFITVLVVAHHAMLAYYPFAPGAPANLIVQPRWWQAFPVVDSARWIGFALLVGFNDIFFMSLMFFLSGLFVWNSLQRKGAGAFVRDRVVRLGVPFALAAAVVAPLAYYPAYLTTASHTGMRDSGSNGGRWGTGLRARSGSSGCCWHSDWWQRRCFWCFRSGAKRWAV
jgi:Acyltransferase family